MPETVVVGDFDVVIDLRVVDIEPITLTFQVLHVLFGVFELVEIVKLKVAPAHLV